LPKFLTNKNSLTMKKSILLVAIIAAASFTSCKKDRTCTCTTTTVATTTTSYPGTTPKTTSSTSTNAGVVTFTKARKGDAKAACLSQKTSDTDDSTPYVSTTYESTSDCSIK
jgi:hypothetical protein